MNPDRKRLTAVRARPEQSIKADPRPRQRVQPLEEARFVVGTGAAGVGAGGVGDGSVPSVTPLLPPTH